jgi:hypothetical protein
MNIPEGRIGYESIWSGTETGWVERSYTDKDLLSTDSETQREVQGWLYSLTHPWSDSAVSYVVNMHHDPSKADTPWKAEMTSIPYDSITASLIAYGKTPEDALHEVHALLERLSQILLILEESEREEE